MSEVYLVRQLDLPEPLISLICRNLFTRFGNLAATAISIGVSPCIKKTFIYEQFVYMYKKGKILHQACGAKFHIVSRHS